MAENAAAPSTDEPLEEFAVFTIGGKKVEVPAFTLETFDMARTTLNLIQPGQDWIDTAKNIVKVIAIALSDEETQKRFARLWPELAQPLPVDELAALVRSKLKTAELAGLTPSFAELLRVSGFTKKGEALAASGSTETSDRSSPSSQPEASAVATGTA